MKTILLCIIISSAFVFKAGAQKNDPYIKELSQPLVNFCITKAHPSLIAGTRVFENEGRLHSSYIELNLDSTFFFFNETEGHTVRLSIGKWSMYHDSVILMHTNNKQTIAAALESQTKGTLYNKLPAEPVQLYHWAFVEKKDTLHLSSGPDSDSAKFFESYKGRMFYPIKSTAAQKAGDRRADTIPRWTSQPLPFISLTRKTSQDVYAVFDGEIIMLLELEDSSYVTTVQYDDYYISYTGIEKADLHKGQHIKKGERISRTVKDLNGNFTLELYIAKRYKDLSPFEWLEQ